MFNNKCMIKNITIFITILFFQTNLYALEKNDCSGLKKDSTFKYLKCKTNFFGKIGKKDKSNENGDKLKKSFFKKPNFLKKYSEWHKRITPSNN